jgi:hypothetical protein
MAEAMMQEKQQRKLRQEIVRLHAQYSKCDSISKRFVLMERYSELVKTIRTVCQHELVIVLYSQSRDYEENCSVSGQHQCVLCGTMENGYNAEVDMQNYVWNYGTYKVLKAEPFARFESGKGYGEMKDMPGCTQGRWTIGDPLDTDLDKLLEWIGKVGYIHYTAAQLKAYDEKRRADKTEAQYQWLKKENYDRLKKEFTEIA